MVDSVHGPALEKLTSRQREIALLASAGQTNAHIAEQLHLSERTIENHLAAVFDRLGVPSRTALVSLLLRQNEPDGPYEIEEGALVVPPPAVATVLRELRGIRLIWVVASAGYGKTTTVNRVARRWKRRAYFDAFGITTPAGLASGLLAALAEECPERASSIGQTIISAGKDSARLIAAARAEWFAPTPGRSALVIDHLEGIADSEPARDFLNELFSRNVPQRTVILCSRVPIMLRTSSFSRPHEALLVEADDLRFDEATVRAVMPPGTSSDIIRDVSAATRGWPIGVLFLARESRTRPIRHAIERFRQGHKSIEDYVVQQVIDSLDGLQLRAMITCAAVPDLTPLEASLALGLPTVQTTDLIKTLQFVAMYAGKKNIDLHPLLRSVLHQRHEKAIREQRLLLARRLRDSGNGMRSAHLFMVSGEVAEAEAAIASLSETDYGAAAPIDFAQLIATLDRDTLVKSPGLWAFSGMTRVSVIGCAEWLREARTVWANLSDDLPFSVRGIVFASYMSSAGCVGEFAEGASILEQFKNSLVQVGAEERQGAELVVRLWETTYAAWQDERYDMDSASEELAPAIAADPTFALWHLNIYGPYLRAHGRKEEEAAVIPAARAAAYRSQVPAVLSAMLMSIAFHHWYYGNDAEFEASLRELEENTTPAILEMVRHFNACCRGRGRAEPPGGEPYRYTVFGYLIAASIAADDFESIKLLQKAIALSAQIKSPFHGALGNVAAALRSSGSVRASHLDEALRLAAKTQSKEFILDVNNVVHGRPVSGHLNAFAGRFASQNRTDSPAAFENVSGFQVPP